METMKQKFDHYTDVSYSGRQLMKKYKLDEYALWQVLGEDPNPDMGGNHYQPDVGLFEGTLKDAIEWAVVQPRFYSWGGGGSFSKKEIIINHKEGVKDMKVEPKISVSLTAEQVKEILIEWSKKNYSFDVSSVSFSLSEGGDQRDPYKVFAGANINMKGG